MRDAGNISNSLITQIHSFLAVSDLLAVAELGPTLKQGSQLVARGQPRARDTALFCLPGYWDCEHIF